MAAPAVASAAVLVAEAKADSAEDARVAKAANLVAAPAKGNSVAVRVDAARSPSFVAGPAARPREVVKVAAAEDSEQAPVSQARVAPERAREANVNEVVRLNRVRMKPAAKDDVAGRAADVAPKVADAAVKAEANSPSRIASGLANECSSY